MAQVALLKPNPEAPQPDVIDSSLKSVRGKGDLELGYLRVITETIKDEQWRYAMRPGKGQHLEYRDISSTEFEIRLVNDPGADVPAREASGKPSKRTYTEMDAAELRTLIVERGMSDPGATTRVGDMIKVLQNDDARIEREKGGKKG